jgi:hypothetical protein
LGAMSGCTRDLTVTQDSRLHPVRSQLPGEKRFEEIGAEGGKEKEKDGRGGRIGGEEGTKWCNFFKMREREGDI